MILLFLFMQAFDLLLEKMKSEKIPFDRIAAVSGSGQVKCGSVSRF